MSIELPKIDTANLWDKTYMVLKDLIIHRKFKPNEKLSIPDLASQLGVSRTPIRDALNRLEMEGLVKTISKVGTFVTAIGDSEVLDIIDTRLMLELWVVDKLSACPDEELTPKLQPLEDVLDKSSRLVESLPIDEYLRSDYNLQFHMAFIHLGDNRRNIDIYFSLMSYHGLAIEKALFTKEMVTSALNQHYCIINALKCRDFDQVRASIKLHLEDSRERLIKRLKENGGEL